jgi:AraC-like DNA-binding protein
MSIYAPAMTFIWQTIEAYGLDPGPMFAAEGIRSGLPADPRQRIPKDALDRIRARAVERLGVADFGLQAARFVHPSNFGALGYAWMASSTLRSALGRMSKFIRVFNFDAEVVLEDRGSDLVVTDYIHSHSENYAARDDTSLAVLVQMCRFICGQAFSPERVAIRHGKPLDTGPWRAYFACPVHFGEPENRLWIDRQKADRNLPGANAQLAMMNEQVLAREFARLDVRDVAARVRAEVTARLGSGELGEAVVAGSLQMTVRTMHRRLASQGTNYRALLAEVRRETAERYLRNSELPMTEIAFRLGFTQVSSFSRAFRKWTGVAPSRVRRKPGS